MLGAIEKEKKNKENDSLLFKLQAIETFEKEIAKAKLWWNANCTKLVFYFQSFQQLLNLCQNKTSRKQIVQRVKRGYRLRGEVLKIAQISSNIPSIFRKLFYFSTESRKWFLCEQCQKNVDFLVVSAVAQKKKEKEPFGIQIPSDWLEWFDSKRRSRWFDRWLLFEKIDLAKIAERRQLLKEFSFGHLQQRTKATSKNQQKTQPKQEEEEEDESETQEEDRKKDEKCQVLESKNTPRTPSTTTTEEAATILGNYTNAEHLTTKLWIEYGCQDVDALEIVDTAYAQGRRRKKFEQAEQHSRWWWSTYRFNACVWEELWQNPICFLSSPSLLETIKKEDKALKTHPGQRQKQTRGPKVTEEIEAAFVTQASVAHPNPMEGVPSDLRAAILFAKLRGTIEEHFFPVAGLYLAPWSLCLSQQGHHQTQKEANYENYEGVFAAASLNLEEDSEKSREKNDYVFETLDELFLNLNYLLHFRIGLFTLVSRHCQELLCQWIGTVRSDKRILVKQESDLQKEIGDWLWFRKQEYFQSFRVRNEQYIIDVLTDSGEHIQKNKNFEPAAHFTNEPPVGQSDNALAVQIMLSQTEIEMEKKKSRFKSSKDSTALEPLEFSDFSSVNNSSVGQSQIWLQTIREINSGQEIFIIYNCIETKTLKKIEKPYEHGQETVASKRTLSIPIQSHIMRLALAVNPRLQSKIADFVRSRVEKYSIDDFFWRKLLSPSQDSHLVRK